MFDKGKCVIANRSEIRGRILLADDDTEVLRSTRLVLAHSGFAVDTVGDRSTVIEALANTSYDLLITDIHMPGNADLGLLKELQVDGALVPVIIITGYPSMSTVVGALRLAVVDYLVKPLDPRELLQATERGIEKGRALRAVGAAHQAAAELTQWTQSLGAVLRLPGAVLPAAASTRPEPTTPGELRYEIGASRRQLGLLRQIWSSDDDTLCADLVGQLCYRALRNRATACNGCPAFDSAATESSTGVIRADEGPHPFHIVVVEKTDRDTLAVRSQPIGEELLGDLVRAKIDALAEHGSLTQRERSVLHHLIEGRAAPDIGTLLGISSRTVKFHQSNLLEKLGADSRVDLLRLVF